MPLDLSAVERLGSLELKARAIVDHVATGRHLSPLRGFSIEFSQYREYTPGDDSRYVDWKVFGKTDKVYLKQFDDETHFGCQILVDVSESMGFQSAPAPLSKMAYAKLLAASLSYLIVRQQDAARVNLFHTTVEPSPSFARNWSSLSPMLEVLDQATLQPEGRLGACLESVAGWLNRRSIVVVISDFLEEIDSVLRGIRSLRYHRHDVILAQVLDPFEREFPLNRWTEFEGMEGIPSITVDARAIRAAYLEEYRKFQGQLSEACLESHIDFFPISTSHPLDFVLRAITQRNPQLLVN